MGEYQHEKLRATIEIPDPFLGSHWEAYSRTGRENGELTVANAQYLRALAVLEKAEVSINGKALDLDDLKKMGLDAPFALVLWVGKTVGNFVDEQFAISKNSSEPPSSPPTAAERETSG